MMSRCAVDRVMASEELCVALQDQDAEQPREGGADMKVEDAES